MTQEKVPASPLAVLQLFRVVFRAAQQYSADTEKALGISGAQAWLMAHPEHAEFDLRFDAVLIAPRSLPRHLLAAFDASP